MLDTQVLQGQLNCSPDWRLGSRACYGARRERRLLWRLWYFHNETRSWGYLSHGWEGIGVERNFGLAFDSLKYMNRDMEAKGISPLPAFEAPPHRCCPLWGSGGRQLRSIIVGNNPFLLHVAVRSISDCCGRTRDVGEPWRSRLSFIISSGSAHSFWPW